MHFSGIFARLQELPNYVWDSDIKPFHSVSVLGYHIERVNLTMYSPTTTGTSLATRRPRRHTKDHHREDEAPLSHRLPRIRQTRAVHRTYSDTSHLAAMPVPQQHKRMPPPRPCTERDDR